MSAVHTGLRMEYATVECRRRRHPLVVKRRRRVLHVPNGLWNRVSDPSGTPMCRSEWEDFIQCVCGEYRAAISQETRQVVGERERRQEAI